MNNLLTKENQLHISNLKGTKLHGFHAIGTNTLTNNFCIKMNNPQSKIKINKSDLSNNTHLKNYIKICNFNKQTTFALWTKRKDIIQAYFDKHKKPKNLILIYSNPIVDRPILKPFGYFDKIFNNVTMNNPQFKENQNCTGQKCIDCLRCYKKSTKDKNNIIFEGVKHASKTKPIKNICTVCYSHKGINFRKHTLYNPLEKNSKLLQTDLKSIQVPQLPYIYFRFSHHGELIS
tara:strand:- start:36 stop:734 length:699 start_codon:yes stop_codon:yes gene_type:complete